MYVLYSDLKLSPTPTSMNVQFGDGKEVEQRTHLIVCVNGEVGTGFQDLLLNNFRKHLTQALPDAKLCFLMSEVNKVQKDQELSGERLRLIAFCRCFRRKPP